MSTPPGAIRLSFVIITHGRAALLQRCVESLDSEGTSDVEILVAFNGPQTSRPVLRRRGVKVVELPRRMSRGAARNLAAAQALGDILYFLDDDVIAPPGFAQRVLAKFARYPRVCGIGGPNLAAPGGTPFQTAVDFLLRSPCGAGPMRVRYRAAGGDRFAPAWCFMLCNLGVRRSVFAGQRRLAFPESCVSAEENLLLHRMEQAHGRALLSSELCVYHVRRQDLPGFFRQVFQSGQGRIQITRMEPRSLQAVVFLPLLVLACLFLPALRPKSYGLWLPLAGYGAVCLVEALRLFCQAPRNKEDVSAVPGPFPYGQAPGLHPHRTHRGLDAFMLRARRHRNSGRADDAQRDRKHRQGPGRGLDPAGPRPDEQGA